METASRQWLREQNVLYDVKTLLGSLYTYFPMHHYTTRRRFQFSLGGLFLLMAAIGLALSHPAVFFGSIVLIAAFIFLVSVLVVWLVLVFFLPAAHIAKIMHRDQVGRLPRFAALSGFLLLLLVAAVCVALRIQSLS